MNKNRPKLSKLLTSMGFQILLAMVIGVTAGIFMGKDAAIFAPLGTLFIQLIKMLVVPLVALSIISGAASLGATRSAGKIGASTLAYIFLTTLFSVTISIALGLIFKPGQGVDIHAAASMMGNTNTLEQASAPGFWETIIGIVPDNIFAALTSGNILQIIFFGLFLGIGISTMPTTKKDPIINGINHILDAMIWMIKVVMYTAPIGVFGLMADSVGSFGFDLILSVLNLVWVFIIGILLIGLIFYPITIKLFSKLKLSTFFKAMTKPQIVAFSTASSLATLPLNMETCENELGVTKETTAFVLPLGATINMAGNAMYYALVALFFSQVYGIDLSVAQYTAIILTSTVGAVGQAGVPGPTLLVVAVLVAADIPIEGLPILYALDRVFDMIRTTLNITGDACCAVIVDRFNQIKTH
jgi:Na+/H+-dicarboxylate symporter